MRNSPPITNFQSLEVESIKAQSHLTQIMERDGLKLHTRCVEWSDQNDWSRNEERTGAKKINRRLRDTK